jgi:hypothetical protein
VRGPAASYCLHALIGPQRLLLSLRENSNHRLAGAEEPALIRKILTHVQAREKPAGVAARAPPEVGHQESELF